MLFDDQPSDVQQLLEHVLPLDLPASVEGLAWLHHLGGRAPESDQRLFDTLTGAFGQVLCRGRRLEDGAAEAGSHGVGVGYFDPVVEDLVDPVQGPFSLIHAAIASIRSRKETARFNQISAVLRSTRVPPPVPLAWVSLTS